MSKRNISFKPTQVRKTMPYDKYTNESVKEFSWGSF